MISSKHISKIIAVAVCVCLIACGFLFYAASVFDTTRIPEYQTRMFGGEVVTIDIQVNEEDWQGLLDNAQSKEWISADLTIDGERFSTVGVRTKGNSSLSMGGAMRSGGGDFRYSLQFKANKHVRGQTFYGLDTFCVNNMMGDATYMKEYIAYDIMNFIGVATPLVNYAKVTVNGEDYGFCLMLERYDQSFLDRVYNTAAGQLYNVKIQMGMRGDFEDMWQDVENFSPGRRQGGGEMQPPGRQPDGEDAVGRQPGGGFSDMEGGMGGGPGGGMGIMGGFGRGGGGSLVYTDDNISSYSAIFDNAVFNSITDREKQRVITALENLNAGTDLEKYFDVDATLRYFAAHTVVVNLDSYISNMQQNYYLYERDGKITILPWDYNLAFGGFQSGDATSFVNFPIDTPVSGVSMEERPLLNKLLEVDEYLERYHGYLLEIVEGYFESGLFEETVNALDAKINEFVKNDVNVFYTHEQYEASLPIFIELGNLRAESIRGQLEGTIPSTSSGQNADSSALIDASGINISALGSMMGGGMGQGGPQDGQEGGRGGRQPGGQGEMPDDGTFDMALMREAMQILMESGGAMTEETKAALLELGLSEDQIERLSERMSGEQGGRGGMPGGGFPGMGGEGAMPGGGAQQNISSIGYIMLITVLLAILAAAIIIIARPKKNVV